MLLAKINSGKKKFNNIGIDWATYIDEIKEGVEGVEGRKDPDFGLDPYQMNCNIY